MFEVSPNGVYTQVKEVSRVPGMMSMMGMSPWIVPVMGITGIVIMLGVLTALRHEMSQRHALGEASSSLDPPDSIAQLQDQYTRGLISLDEFSRRVEQIVRKEPPW